MAAGKPKVVRAAAAGVKARVEIRQKAEIKEKRRSSLAAIRPRAAAEEPVAAVEEARFLLPDNRACPGTCRSSQ